MSVDYAGTLERVLRVPGVRGALVLDADAGVPVVSELGAGLDAGVLAALAASVRRLHGDALVPLAPGEPETVQLEAEGGHVVIAGRGEVLLVAVADAEAQIGIVRLEAARAAEGLG